MRWIGLQWRRFQDWLYNVRPYLIIFALVAVFVILFEWPRVVVVIHSGELGVEYKVFEGGTITDYLYPEGVHFVLPWNTMFVYNIRVQETQKNISVLTSDGLDVEIDLVIRYRPEPTMLGVLQQQVGPDYANKVAIPEVESAVRSSIGKLTIQQLYGGIPPRAQVANTTSGAAAIPNSSIAVSANQGGTPETADTSLEAAFEAAIDQAEKKYVLIDKVMVTRIKIPDYVENAIQKKMEQEQIAEAQDYRLETSQKEIAIANNEKISNDTVRSSLDENLLKLRGIEATEKIAQSPNTKVVVMGNGPNSLPVILGSDK